MPIKPEQKVASNKKRPNWKKESREGVSRKAKSPRKQMAGKKKKSEGKSSPTRVTPQPTQEHRLNRFVSDAGGVSRREADRLIREGHVTLNGRVVREPGTRLDPKKDAVKMNGKRIAGKPAPVYYLFNKPRGVVSTMEDPEGRPCVGDFLKKVKGRPVPAGRLDFDSEGLILCTNDGEVVQRIIHPRHKVRKVYLVKINGFPRERSLDRLRKGVMLDGKKTLPAGVSVIRQGKKNCWLRVALHEGRNRQIKRMIEQVRFRVLKLRRVSLGPLKLAGMKPGDYRRLSREEVQKLQHALIGP